MYLLKNKNIYFGILLSGIFLLICLPNSLKESLSVSFFDYSFLIPSIVYIPFLLKAIINIKTDKITRISIAYIILCLLTVFVAEDFIFQRFFISLLFFIPFFIISDIKWDAEKIKILKYFTLFTFLFISLQVILSSLGLVKFNNTESNEIGLYNRVGTTAGVASFTAPVLLVLFAILHTLYKNRLIRLSLLFVVAIGVFLSGTRSALLVLVITLFINTIFVLKPKYKVFLIILSIFLAPIIDDKFKVQETIEARNKNAKDYSNGDVTSGRVERWLYVYNKIKENPESLLTGIGGGNTPYYNKYLKTDLKPTSSPHNVYLAVLYEHGIILLFLFFLILFFLAKKVLKNINLSTLIFVFVIIVTFNTEVFPLGGGFSSLFFMLYILLAKEKEINLLLSA